MKLSFSNIEAWSLSKIAAWWWVSLSRRRFFIESPVAHLLQQPWSPDLCSSMADLFVDGVPDGFLGCVPRGGWGCRGDWGVKATVSATSCSPLGLLMAEIAATLQQGGGGGGN